jgi:3-carboxy-cis,cis-muconate cycloisomerase
MQIREALAILKRISTASATGWRRSPRKYRDTPMAGRSNLQTGGADPFGYKMATHARRLRTP